MDRKKIVFVSTNWAAPWGGSELLWSQAAHALIRFGHAASASVYRWPKPADQIRRLREAGVSVHERGWKLATLGPPLLGKVFGLFGRQFAMRTFPSWIRRQAPNLICLSLGSPADDPALIKHCAASGIPYVIVLQANSEHLWPDDARAGLLRTLFTNAQRSFFVSRGNLRLLETQLGTDLPNSEIVRNPFNLNCTVPVAWPIDDGPLKLACVGRLDPRAKGQDLVFGILASEFWRKRDISLSLFGSGEMEMGLRRLADRLRLSGRVQFCGHVDDVREIWANHHALILPSRFEGLPLAIVEAMLCGRPAIVTDVGGNAELVSEGMNGFIAEAATERHLGEAMERAWQKRADWKTMGMTAAAAIRRCIPLDPAAEFARKLINLAA